MKTTSKLLLLCATPLVMAATVQASIDITPSFAGAPAGWTTDRYNPNSFSDVGTYQGRNNVLGIGISSAQRLTSRPAGYQDTFYNTQGMQQALQGGVGSTLTADLYIPTSWGDAANGSIRTDMWGVTTDGTGITGYPIIGFSNYGGAARLRVYDYTAANGSTAQWVDLPTTIAYDQWTTLSIELTASSYIFSVNGTQVWADTEINGATGFSAMIMQAYNFGDSSLSGANAVDYTAYWANTPPVPEPSTYIAGALLLVPFGASFFRLFRKQKTA